MLCSVHSTTLGLITKIRRWWSKWVQNCASHITHCLLHHFPLIIVLRKDQQQVMMFAFLLSLNYIRHISSWVWGISFCMSKWRSKPKYVARFLLWLSSNIKNIGMVLEIIKREVQTFWSGREKNPFLSVLQRLIKLQLWLTTKGLVRYLHS